MNLVTKTQKIKDVAASWHRQYYKKSQRCIPDADKAAIYEALLALHEGASEDQVAEAIGNRSWTSNRCSECGNDVEALVQVGEEPSYESITAWLCGDCINRAAALLNDSNG
jgi:ribosomal protein S14